MQRMVRGQRLFTQARSKRPSERGNAGRSKIRSAHGDGVLRCMLRLDWLRGRRGNRGPTALLKLCVLVEELQQLAVGFEHQLTRRHGDIWQRELSNSGNTSSFVRLPALRRWTNDTTSDLLSADADSGSIQSAGGLRRIVYPLTSKPPRGQLRAPGAHER